MSYSNEERWGGVNRTANRKLEEEGKMGNGRKKMEAATEWNESINWSQWMRHTQPIFHTLMFYKQRHAN